MHLGETMVTCTKMNRIGTSLSERIKIVLAGPAVKIRSGEFDGPWRLVADLVGLRLRDRFTDEQVFVTGWMDGHYILMRRQGVERFTPSLIANVFYLDTELDTEIASPLN